MKRLRLLLCGLLLATAPATAQTNDSDATNPPAPAAGPVVMPPGATNDVPADTSSDSNAAPPSPGPVIMPPAGANPAPPEETSPPPRPVTSDHGPVTIPPSGTNLPPEEAPSAPASGQGPVVMPPIALGSSGATPGPKNEIYDIRPPVFFLHPWLWLWFALSIVVLGLLALLVWLLLRPRSTLNPLAAYDTTLEQLEKARALMRESDPVPYAVFVSETIRIYLGQRFLTPSSRRTTEEFLRQMESSPGTPLAEYRDLLRDFLQACDLVKFARYRPTLAELEQVQTRAVTFVTATKPAPVTNPLPRP